MIKLYRIHTLQNNPRHRDEEPHNVNSHKSPDNESKATSCLFLVKMIAKLERKLSKGITKQVPNTEQVTNNPLW